MGYKLRRLDHRFSEAEQKVCTSRGTYMNGSSMCRQLQNHDSTTGSSSHIHCKYKP